jgi:hypothetical protein
MRVLLVQPEDSARGGPWTGESWDLAVDLGRLSARAAEEWSEKMGCPVLRLGDFIKDVEDIRRMGEIFAAADGRLRDDEGIDWWKLGCLDVLREAASVLALERMAAEIPRSATLWCTRPGWPAAALASILSLPLRAYGENLMARGAKRFLRYARLPHHFSAGQLKEIFLDKYDAAYRWRAHFAVSVRPESKPVVLIPSAYTNVSRMASAYASLLPEQTFLLVATRRSAKLFHAPENVKVQDLGSYAEKKAPRVLNEILQKWAILSRELQANMELATLQRLGLFDQFPATFAQGLAVRNAWGRVFEREPVCGVLCGDDTNSNTRLPVFLAIQRGLPALDFHHGAMDGYYLAKRLCCDFYLAKNELERDYLVRVSGLPADQIVLGAPPAMYSSARLWLGAENFPTAKTAIVFFSEPYENVGARTEEVYRELLPALCTVARQLERRVVLKLHPFESPIQRSKIMQTILSPDDCKRVMIVSGPLSENMLSQTWAGVTVESTTVLDCALRGIPCFICEWLAFSPFGYVQQYARFGAGQCLRSAEEIADIPGRVKGQQSEIRPECRSQDKGFLWQQINPRLLAQLLGVESIEPAARPA